MNEPTLAARAIAAAGNDIKRATDEAVRLLTADDEALHELMPALIREWCAAQVCSHLSRIRAAAIYPAAVDQGGARLRAAMRVFLMDFPLPGTGKRLGDAALIEAGLLIRPEDGGEPYDRFRSRVMFPIHDARCRPMAPPRRNRAGGEKRIGHFFWELYILVP